MANSIEVIFVVSLTNRSSLPNQLQNIFNMHNMEKRLATLFKDFFQKTCLSVIKQHLPILKQWLYFSSMLSQQSVDLARIQRYIQSLSPINPSLSFSDTTKNFPSPSFAQSDPLGATFKRKKNEIIVKDRFSYPTTQSYSSAITIGQPIFNLKSYPSNDLAKTREEVLGSSKPKFKLTDEEITKPMVSKLNCLYMTFVDNQHKIEFPKKESEGRRYSDMHEMIYR